MSALFTNETIVEPGSNPLVISGIVTATPIGTQDVNIVSTVSLPVTGPLTDTQLRATPVPVTSVPVKSNVNTITQVVVPSSTNTTLLSANANRKKLIITLPKGSAATWVKFGATASSSSFTYPIVSNNTTLEDTIWTGQVDIIGAAQTVTVNELT